MRLLASALLASGCSFAAAFVPAPAPPPQQSKCSRMQPAVDTAVGVTSIALGAILASTCLEEKPCTDIILWAFLTGPVSLVSGIYGAATLGECETREREARERERLVAEKAERRERAWQSTKSAQARARARDCAGAFAIADRVRLLDEEMFETVLQRDAAFARCREACAAAADCL